MPKKKKEANKESKIKLETFFSLFRKIKDKNKKELARCSRAVIYSKKLSSPYKARINKEAFELVSI